MRMRLAVIGCGFIGRRHLENIVAREDVVLEAVADLDEATAAAAAQKFGARYHATCAQQVIGDRQVDAVVIATHHDSHTTLALQAAAAGKHILLEKPMALTPADCARIAGAVQRAGVTFTVNFKFRFAPAVLKVKEVVSRPVITLGQLAMERMPDDSWVRDPLKGGGLILATACHVLDQIYWLNESEPVRVYAEGAEDAASATVRFANGATASLLLADAGENPYVGKWLHQVYDGRRSAVLYDHFRKARFSGAPIEDYIAPDDIRADGTYGLLENFVQSVNQGLPPAIAARDGLRATLVAARILESLRTGQPQEVSLDGAA